MRIHRLARNEDNRRITLAAIMTGLVGGLSLVPAVLNGAAEGFGTARLGAVVYGVILLALAIGTYRRIRACAAAALVLYLADRLSFAMVVGPLALLSIWFWIVASILVAGVRAVWAEHAIRETAQARPADP